MDFRGVIGSWSISALWLSASAGRTFRISRFSGFVWAGVLFLLAGGATTSTAIDITPPEVGATEFAVTDIAVPASIHVGPKGNRLMGLVAWMHQSVAQKKSAEVSETSSVRWGIASPTEIETVVELSSAVTGQDTILVIDSYGGDSAAWEDSADQPGMVIDMAGFDVGAAEVTITGIDPGTSLVSVYVTPGAGPSSTTLTDGGWADRDGEVNGIIISGPLRFFGPDYVLPGDQWMLAVEGSGSGAGVWMAAGDLVRYTVPVASHIIGASGQPFISDLVISNTFGLNLDGWIRFVEDGTDWSSAAEVTFSLAPAETKSWTDVLQSAFGIQRNVKGTLQVGGFPTWTASVSSRNYTVDDEGRQFGIAIPGIATSSPMTFQDVWILPGLRQDGQFRSNLIVAGAVPQESQILVRLIEGGAEVASAQYQVPAYGLLQVNRLAPSLGIPEINDAYVEITVESGAVVATLSVVDGSADDAALIVAQPLIQ